MSVFVGSRGFFGLGRKSEGQDNSGGAQGPCYLRGGDGMCGGCAPSQWLQISGGRKLRAGGQISPAFCSYLDAMCYRDDGGALQTSQLPQFDIK